MLAKQQKISRHRKSKVRSLEANTRTAIINTTLESLQHLSGYEFTELLLRLLLLTITSIADVNTLENFSHHFSYKNQFRKKILY